MPDGLDGLPVKVANFDDNGLNDALDIVVSQGQAREAAAALKANPRIAARRLFRLDACQRAALLEMTDVELARMADPIAEALSRDDPTDFSLVLTQRITRESPLKVRCEIEIETKAF